MLGAIIGDIVGSRWEFVPTNDYDFEMFSEKNSFTDDTVCTVAVADAIAKGAIMARAYMSGVAIIPRLWEDMAGDSDSG